MLSLMRRLGRDARGATALEFGLILPAFVMLVIGVINVAQLSYAVSSMNYAVQEAARCSALNKTSCGNDTAVVSYAQAKYLGPLIGPTFTPSTAGCGHTVVGTATFRLNAALFVYNIPLRAEACFPGVDT
jgi:Flp pilus assembly protein TadG